MKKTSTASQVEKFISARPALKECARLGVLNSSGTARLIQKELGIADGGAATVAVARYARRIRKTPSREREIRAIIMRSKITIRTKMMIAIVRRAASRGRTARVVAEIQQSGEQIALVEGLEISTLVTSQEHARTIRAVLGSSVEEAISDVAILQLLLARKAMLMPGFCAFLLAQIAEMGVNLLEVFTCSGEMLIAVKGADLQRTVQALEECGIAPRKQSEF